MPGKKAHYTSPWTVLHPAKNSHAWILNSVTGRGWNAINSGEKSDERPPSRSSIGFNLRSNKSPLKFKRKGMDGQLKNKLVAQRTIF